MEIRSGGEISWYIGAIGGSGTYTIDGDYLTAELQRAIRDEFSEPEESRKRRTMTKTDDRKPKFIGECNMLRDLETERLFLRSISHEDDAFFTNSFHPIR